MGYLIGNFIESAHGISVGIVLIAPVGSPLHGSIGMALGALFE